MEEQLHLVFAQPGGVDLRDPGQDILATAGQSSKHDANLPSSLFIKDTNDALTSFASIRLGLATRAFAGF